MERQVGLSSVTVDRGALIGTELLGIVGALLAVPTAAIIQVLLQEYVASDRPTEQLTRWPASHDLAYTAVAMV